MEYTDAFLKWWGMKGVNREILERENIRMEEKNGINHMVIPFMAEKTERLSKWIGSNKSEFYSQPPNIVYGIDDIVSGEVIHIVQDEIERLLLVQSGIKNVVALPQKLCNWQECIDGFRNAINNAPAICLVMHKDEFGISNEEKIGEHIGIHKCFNVEYEYDCVSLFDIYKKSGHEGVKKSIMGCKPMPISCVNDFTDYEDDILEYYNRGEARGLSTGFTNIDKHWSHQLGSMNIITGVPSSGKALHIDTDIPTINGWKKMANMCVGDVVFDENGNACNVIAVTNIMYDRPCYELTFSDGVKVIADEQHQWFTEDFKAKCSKRSKKAKDRIIRTHLHCGTNQSWKRTFPSAKTTKQISESLKVEQGKKFNHSIKKCVAVDYDKKELAIHPYLLGVWIGDGRQDNSSITIHDSDLEIKTIIEYLGYEMHKISGNYAYWVSGIMPELRQYNLIKNKHIPNDYLQSDYNDRLTLLQGLMDTDGCVNKNGYCEFYNTNENVINGIKELVSSLGFICSMRSRIGKIYGVEHKRCYTVCFYADVPIAKLKRKYGRQAKDGSKSQARQIIDCKKIDSHPVKCIQVDSDSHLYLCTKAYIPTHNSEVVDALVLNTIRMHGWKWVYYSPENMPAQFHFQKLVEKHIGLPMFGVDRMGLSDLKTSIHRLSKDIKFVTPQENSLDIDAILLKAKVCKQRYKIQGLILDPYNEIEHTRPSHMSEVEYISKFLSNVRHFSRIHNIETFIVAHPTKLQKDDRTGEYPVPTPYDISGAAHWRNKADNCFSVWRKYNDNPDNEVELHVQKVRNKNIGVIGKCGFNWTRSNGRFIEKY